MGEQRTPDAPQGKEPDIEARIQNALKGLVRAYDLESEVVRRHHVKRFLEAEEFWKGNQHLIWSERQFRWQTPFEWALESGRDTSSLPRYQYVTNLYQSLGLSVIAAISQRLPKVRFQPKSAKNEVDIGTARSASDIVDLVERNNQLDMLAVRCAYLLWTQGIFGAWVRFVMDKDFGTQQVPKVEWGDSEVAPDRYFCPQCATETPVNQMQSDGLIPGQSGMTCPGCGAPLSEADFRESEMGQGPVVTGMEEYPEGQEVIDIFGGLNLKMMPTAEKLKESSYLILVQERHLADIRAAYPLKAPQIGYGGSGAPADNNYERYARLSLFDSSPNYRNAQPFSKHVTLMNAWLRTRAFWYLDDDEVRTELIKRYPDGVRVVLAGDEFMEAVPENVDDCWEICRPMPGYGMYVEAVGGSTIPIAKRFNDQSNIQAEHVAFGSAPPVLVDARYINVEALRNKRMEAASYVPIGVQNAPGGTKLADMTKQIEVKIDSMLATGQYGSSLIELAQMVSGALPSIFGGELQGNSTASGYAMSRVQSLGKLNLFWRAVMQFWARLQLLSVECFRKNRTSDFEHVVTGKGTDYSSKFIRLENLKGNITAHPEADQDFPASWAEIRDNVISMLKVAPDETKALLMHAANAPLLKKVMANPDLVIPGEDDREKQYREIEELLGGEPVPEMMPNPGGPMLPGIPSGQLTPTVSAEPFVDNHTAHIQTIQIWSNSDDGITAKRMKPAGYANVMAHLISHLKAQAYETAEVQRIQMQTAAEMGLPPAAGPDDPNGQGNGQNVPRGTQDKKPPKSGKDDGPASATPGQPAQTGVIPGATQPIQDIAQQPI